jgi:hypothetical protein
MPIYRLLQNMPMEPEEISRLSASLTGAIRWLNFSPGKSLKSHRLASASPPTSLLRRSRKSASQRRNLHVAPTSLIVTRKRFSLAKSRVISIDCTIPVKDATPPLRSKPETLIACPVRRE